MDQLLLRLNHIILSKIFMYLDAQSLKQAQKVCRSWHSYISRHIWGVRFYKDVLRQRLDEQWTTFEPRENVIRCRSCVFEIQADQDEFVFSLESGEIEVWDRCKLTKSYEIPEAGKGHGLRLGLTKELIIGGFFDKFFSVFSRTGEKSLLWNQELESNVHGLTVGVKKLIVSMVNGNISVFSILQERQIQLVTTISGGVRSPCHFGFQDNWLLHTFNRRNLVLFDLEQNLKVKTMMGGANVTRIWRVCLSYPLAAVYGKVAPENAESSRRRKMILIWNLIQGTRIKSIDMEDPGMDVDGYAMDVYGLAMDDKRLTVVTDRVVLLLNLNQLDWPFHVFNRLPDTQTSRMTGIRLESDQVIFQANARGLIKILNVWYGIPPPGKNHVLALDATDATKHVGWKQKVKMKLCQSQSYTEENQIV